MHVIAWSVSVEAEVEETADDATQHTLKEAEEGKERTVTVAATSQM